MRYQLIYFLGLTFLGAVLLSGCSSDNEKKETADIEGLWRITEEKVYLNNSGDPTAILKDSEDNTEDENTDNDQSDSEESEWKTVEYTEESDELFYMSFENLIYKEFISITEDEETTNATIAEGSYTVNHQTISISINESISSAEILLNGNELTLYYSDDHRLKERRAVRVTQSVDNGNGNDETNGEEEQEITGCAINHQINSPLGAYMNPQLIELDTQYEGLLPDSTNHGAEHRYYIQVVPYNHYRITVMEVDANYHPDLISAFRYLEVTAKEELMTNTVLQEMSIKEKQNGGEMIVNPGTECLYIRFFSYQNNLSYKILVEEVNN